MPAVLQVISERGMLAVLGFNCGQIILEDGTAHAFLFRKAGERILFNLLAKGLLSEEEAETMLSALVNVEPYLASDLSEVLAALPHYRTRAPMNGWEFLRCDSCAMPVPHGFIMHNNSLAVSMPITSLEEAFLNLQTASIQIDELWGYQAIELLREMKDASLPPSAEEAKNRIAKEHISSSGIIRLPKPSFEELCAEDAETPEAERERFPN